MENEVLKALISQVKYHTGTSKILWIAQVGSKLFIENGHDNDLLFLVSDNPKNVTRYFVNENDLFILTPEQLTKQLEGEGYYANFNINLLMPNITIYGTAPAELKNYTPKSLLSQALRAASTGALSPSVLSKKGTISPRVMYLLAVYFIAKNGKYDLSSEQKSILQKAHDAEIPAEYKQAIYEAISAYLA